MKASDWGTEKQEHKWKISDIGTFASNIGLILFQCSKGAGKKNEYSLTVTGQTDRIKDRMFLPLKINLDIFHTFREKSDDCS